MLYVLGYRVGVTEAADADAVCAQQHVRRALEHTTVLKSVGIVERMKYALKDLFDNNIRRITGFNLLIYALQGRD